MQGIIVQTATSDKLPLYGILTPARSDTILLAIHGTASNFYENDFMPSIADALRGINIATLAVNNRGTGVLLAYPPMGAAMERFEDCVKDIDAWIAFCIKKGYKKIILQGHSLGTEKVTYYMSKGKHKGKVTGVILLAFADSFGNQLQHKEKDQLMTEAKSLVKADKGYQFLTTDWLSHSSVLPKDADSYVNFFSENSELSKALPLRKGKELLLYRQIKVSILAVIGDQKEYTIIPIKDAIKLLKKENPLTQAHQLSCNHEFSGKEKQLATLIRNFAKKL